MRMSQYETEQLLKFIDAMFPDWKCIMDRGTCRSEGFIAYLRKMGKYRCILDKPQYWDYVQRILEEHFDEMRKERNDRMKVESRLSLNRKYGESKEKIGCLFASKNGDFVKRIALWDFMDHLGDRKYKVARLLYSREEKKEIIKILELSEHDYDAIIQELRLDFQEYIHVEDKKQT